MAITSKSADFTRKFPKIWYFFAVKHKIYWKKTMLGLSKAYHIMNRKPTITSFSTPSILRYHEASLFWLKAEKCYWLHEKPLIKKIYRQGKTTSFFQTTRHNVNLIWNYGQQKHRVKQNTYSQYQYNLLTKFYMEKKQSFPRLFTPQCLRDI